MKKAKIFVNGTFAGILEEMVLGRDYKFTYDASYAGSSVSLLMPTNKKLYQFNRFPPFFEGVLPEGLMLEAS